MRYKFLLLMFIILLTSQVVSAYGYTNIAHNYYNNNPSGLGAAQLSGVRVRVGNDNITVTNITIGSNSTADTLTVYNESLSLLFTKTVNKFIFTFTTGTFNMTAGRNYTFMFQNISGAAWTMSVPLVTPTLPISTNSELNWTQGMFPDVNTPQNGVYFANIVSITYFGTGLAVNSSNYSSTVAQTQTQNISVNISLPSTPTSVTLEYNNANYTSTITNEGTNNYIFKNTFDTPLSSGSIIFTYSILQSNGTRVRTLELSQTINDLLLFICSGSGINPLINFTYQNEETLTTMAVKVDSSTFSYWLGTGTLNKTLTYSNTTLSNITTFCASGSSLPMTCSFSITYSNTSFQQRTYRENNSIILNTTAGRILYLLSDSTGLFNPFQIVDSQGTAISGAYVYIYRTINSVSVQVSSAISDSSGLVTFFLDPNQQYTVKVVASGFADNTLIFSPTTTLRLITLGGGITAVSTIANQTIISVNTSYVTYPLNSSLNNGTTYLFGLMVNSSQSINFISMNVTNKSGYQIKYVTSLSQGLISTSINTVNNQTFIVYYKISTSSESFTFTRTFVIGTIFIGDYSLYNQLILFNSYDADDWVRIFIVLIIIFMGIYSLSSTEVLESTESKLALALVLIWFFSYVGWLDTGIAINSTNVQLNVLASMSNKYGIAILLSFFATALLIRRNR